MWPDHEILERDGRLVLGGCPRTRRGNAVGLAVALVVALPVFLSFLWLGCLDVRIVAPLGVLSILGGLAAAWRAATGDWSLSEDRDIVFDRIANRVAKKGVCLCKASEITHVELRHDEGPPDLVLVLGVAPAQAATTQHRLPILNGYDLSTLGPRVAEYLGVPFVKN